MANYNEHKCFTCGRIFEYCRHCAVTPIVYKAEGFCSENCSHIFNILSKHGCNLATAEETFEALIDYDTTNVTEVIQTHIDALTSEIQGTESEAVAVEQVAEESVVETIYNKKNKNKKW